jgi:serine/threonine-protein kinase
MSEPSHAGIPGPGETVADKYVVERVLATGGMGVVVKARHTVLEQDVALKFLRADTKISDDAMARFTREARAAARIRGEHVVRILDVGALPSGLPFIVMELLSGSDLATIAESRGTLAPHEVADFVLQACEALAQAHAMGIVHRDLKPQNMFVTTRPDGAPLVKVVDFGISKLEGNASSVTTSGQLVGSPAYMSPEQLLAPKDVDARSDIWSLGVIMYRLLTGACPFEAATMPELCAHIMAIDVPPLRAKNAAVPEELERVVLRCLEKKPEARYTSVADLAQVLVPFASASEAELALQIARILGPAAAPSAPPSARAPDPPAQETFGGSVSSRQIAASRYGLALAIVAGVASIAVVSALVLARRHDTNAPAAQPAPPASSIAEPPPRELANATPPASTPEPPPVATVVVAPRAEAAKPAPRPARLHHDAGPRMPQER